MDSLLVKVIVQSLYTVLTLFGGGVHTSPTTRLSSLETRTFTLYSLLFPLSNSLTYFYLTSDD